MKSKYLLLLLFLFSITLVSSAPPFQQGTAINGLQIETAIFQSIKADQPFEFYVHAFNKTGGGVLIPNTDLNCTLELINSSGVHTLNVNMTPKLGGVDMEYEANSSEIIKGSYATFIYCHLISEPTVGDFINYNFDITISGENNPGGLVIIIFSLLFLIIIGGMFGLLLYTIFKMIEWSFDARDLIITVSIYFTVFSFYILQKLYLNNTFIDDFLVWLIGVGAFTTVILPIIAFFMSYVKGGLGGNEK